jgi:hypothetical protein
MARSSRSRTSGAADSAPASAIDTPSQATRTEYATKTEPISTDFMAPPQGPGAPRRFRLDGAPRGGARLNMAMRALLDPAARTSATRVYSGQSRGWNR